MTLNEIIAAVKSKANGRTRYEGQDVPWDEVMVAEIERLREHLKSERERHRGSEVYHAATVIWVTCTPIWPVAWEQAEADYDKETKRMVDGEDSTERKGE